MVGGAAGVGVFRRAPGGLIGVPPWPVVVGGGLLAVVPEGSKPKVRNGHWPLVLFAATKAPP